MAARRKILFVALHTSPHTARWIDIAADLGYDLHMFPLDRSAPHQRLRDVTLHVPVSSRPKETVKEAPFERGIGSRALNFLHRVRYNPARAWKSLKQLRLMKPLAEIADVETPVFDTIDSSVKIRHLPTYRTLGAVADITETVRLGRTDESDRTALRIHGPEVLADLIQKLQPDLNSFDGVSTIGLSRACGA